MEKIDLKKIFGDVSSALTEEQIKVLSEQIDEIVDARVKAKINFQTELAEAEAKEKYDALLNESVSQYSTAASEMETLLLEKADGYQQKVIDTLQKFVEQYKAEKEQEVAEFKESLLEKLDSYLELELDKAIPQEVHESAAKLAIFEPIVEDVIKSFKDHYVKVDNQNVGILKEARDELVKTRQALTEAKEQSLALAKKSAELERSVEISKVCEGLLPAQRERAVALLEGVETAQVGKRFSAIRDLILTEKTETKKEEKTEDEVCTGKVVSDKDNEEEESEKSDSDADEVLKEAVSPETQAILSYKKDYERHYGKK